MHTRPARLLFLLGLGMALGLAHDALGQNEPDAFAVSYQGKLIHRDEAGHLRAWNLNDGHPDAALSAKLARVGAQYLAAEGDHLWVAGASTVHAWSPQQQSWQLAAHFDGGREALVALTSHRGSPVLIFPSKVMDLGSGRVFRVPELKGQLEIHKIGRAHV